MNFGEIATALAGANLDKLVIAIRANDMAFMGVLRAAKSIEFDVLGLHYTWPGAPRWYSDASDLWPYRLEITNPAIDSEECARQLHDIGAFLHERLDRKVLVIPSSDTVQMLLFEYEEKLSQVLAMAGTADFSTYRFEMTHKGKFFDLLQATCPDLSPKTLRCLQGDQIPQVLAKTTYPCVVKPAVKDFAQSFYKRNGGAKALLIENHDALKAKLEELVGLGFDLVVQERIQFDSVEDEVPFYAFFDPNHTLRIAASGIKTLIQPHPYGTATILHLSRDQALEVEAQRLGKALNWVGQLMIEFIRDTENGKLRVVEVNTRPWLFHDFYRRAGLPFTVAQILLHHDHVSAKGTLERFLNQVSGDSGTICVPDIRVSAAHVDLPSVAAYFMDRCPAHMDANMHLISNIRAIADIVTFAHGTPLDHAPLNAMIYDCAHAHKLDPRVLLKLAELDTLPS